MNSPPITTIMHTSDEGPAAFGVLIALLHDMISRQVRMETRLCRLLNAHGLDHNGRPTVGQTDIVSVCPTGTTRTAEV